MLVLVRRLNARVRDRISRVRVSDRVRLALMVTCEFDEVYFGPMRLLDLETIEALNISFQKINDRTSAFYP